MNHLSAEPEDRECTRSEFLERERRAEVNKEDRARERVTPVAEQRREFFMRRRLGPGGSSATAPPAQPSCRRLDDLAEGASVERLDARLAREDGLRAARRVTGPPLSALDPPLGDAFRALHASLFFGSREFDFRGLAKKKGAER